MLELKCPNCGKVFFRTVDLAQTVTTCPACQTRLTFNKAGKCTLVKPVEYAREDWDELARARYSEAQKLLRILRNAGYKPTRKLLAIVRHPENDEFHEDMEDAVYAMGVEAKWKPNVKAGVVNWSSGHWVLRRWRPGMEAGTGKVIPYAREDPKYVKTRFNEMKQHNVPFRTRMQVLSREYGGRGGYTSEELHKIVTGKTSRAYYIFPFVKGAPPEVNRILERTYRKHRAAGDSKVAAAIAAWTKVKQAGYVKVTKPAPVWIKKRSYNMEQLKPMQVVNYTAGPRRLGKPRTEEERRKRHKQLHPGEKLPPRGTGLDYGAGVVAGRLAERGVRGLFGAARRHPRIVRGTGLVGVGYLTAKELEKRRKRKKGYQLNAAHFTPDIPLSRGEQLRTHLAKKMPTRKGLVGVGKRIGGTAVSAVKLAIIGLAAKELLDRLRVQKVHSPWLPEIQSDIELGGYEALDQVVEYASVMPSKMVQTLKSKTGAALHRTKKGVERGLLVWLLGFLASELLGRGISKPQRRHEVVFPDQHQLYAKKKRKKIVPWVRKKIREKPLTAAALAAMLGAATEGRYARFHTKGGIDIPGGVSASERLPRSGFQPFTPTKTVQEPLPKFKRKRKLSRKIGSIAALPIAALLAIRLSKRQQEGYSFASAAKRTLRGVKKVGSGLGKGMGVATNIAIPAMIISELWPRKKRRVGPRPVHPPVQSPTQPYGLAKGLQRLLKLKKVKPPPKLGHKLRDLTLARKDSALADINKRLAAAAQKRKKFSLVETYPFVSDAQRRWMHLKKPKMAAEWEEHTPKGKKLPEKVSKHVLAYFQARVSRMPGLQSPAWHKAHPGRWRTPLSQGRAAKLHGAAKLRSVSPIRRAAHTTRKAVRGQRFLPKIVRRHPLGAAVLGAGTLAATLAASRRKRGEKVSKHFLGIPILTPLIIAKILADKKKKQEQVEKHSLSVPWALKRARDLMRLKGAKPQGREVVAWASDLAKKLRSLQLKTVDTKKKVELGARAGRWETIADQVGDIMGRAQLEKVGLLAAATTATGVAAHEVGKKRERARVRRVVG